MLKKIIVLIICGLLLVIAGCSNTSSTTTLTANAMTTSNTSMYTSTTSSTSTTTTTQTTTATRPPSTTTTTKSPYEFKTNEPPANPVPVTGVHSISSFSVPIGWLALQQGDLEEGVVLDASTEVNCVQLSQMTDDIVNSEEGSDLLKKAFLNYTNTLFGSGFVSKWMSISSKSGFQQDIFVFFNSDDAKKCMTSLAQANKEVLEATLKELGIEMQGEIIDIYQSATAGNSWGLQMAGGSGLNKISMSAVCQRENNVLSAITVSSNSLSSTAYSGETIDDALLLNEKALTKIKSVLGEKDLLIKATTSNRFSDLIKLVPAVAANMENTYFAMNDYAAVRELYNIKIPTSITNQAITDYIEAIYGMTDSNDQPTGINEFSFMSGFHRWKDGTPITVNTVGYDLFNTDAEIFTANTQYRSYSENYTDFYNALIGHFSSGKTNEAMNNRISWPQNAIDGYLPEVYKNLSIHNWNDVTANATNSLKPPAFTNLGKIFPFTVTKDRVLSAGTLDEVKSMVEVFLGLTNSLANIKEYRLAAEGLSALNVYAGIIATEKLSNNTQFKKDEGNASLLKPYSVFGVGMGKDLLGQYMALVLVNDDEETAKENYNLLIDRINKTQWIGIANLKWSDYWRFYVDFAQISVEGNVLLAKLYGDRACFFWYEWLFKQNPLLLHE